MPKSSRSISRAPIAKKSTKFTPNNLPSGIEIIDGNFKGKDIVSLDQFDKKSIKILFETVPKMRNIAMKASSSKILAGKIISLLFYEPSTRTHDSFEAAIKQLGGSVIGSPNPAQFSSAIKGEDLYDTIKTEEGYCDLIVLRHPQTKAAQDAATAATTVPIINAGDGIGEHPTQALLDMYTIYEKFGKLSNLKILLVGDIKNGRTVHSLLDGLALYQGNEVYLLSTKNLRLPEDEIKQFENKGLKIHTITTEDEIPKDAHVWYWTRIQKERFSPKELKNYEKIKNSFIVTAQMLKKHANKNMILMHPLPRVNEISKEVDSDPRAVYFKQTRNGMYIRMALLILVLGKQKTIRPHSKT